MPSNVRGCLVFLFLALFALQVLLSSAQMSPAADEVSAIPAGYLFLKTGYWFIPEHPALPFALFALPLPALNPRMDVDEPEVALERPNPWNIG